MPWSGSSPNGTFTRVHDWTDDAAALINIEADRMDAEDDGFETGINACINKAGLNAATGDLPMGGNRHTNVGAATALTHYARVSELIDQDHIYYVDSGSANTYAITPNPAISAYEEGQKFVIRIANANTGATTLNVNALGATAVQTADGSALIANMLLAGGIYEFTFDANASPDRFVVTSPTSKIPDGMLSANVPLLDEGNVFEASQEIRGAIAALTITETGATADEGRWQWRADGDELHLYTLNDAGSAVRDLISITRDGTDAGIFQFGGVGTAELEFNADAFDFNGAADFSSSVAVAGAINGSSHIRAGTGSAFYWEDDGDTYIAAGSANIVLTAATVAVASFSQAEIDLTATTIDLNGSVDADGATMSLRATTGDSSLSSTLGQVNLNAATGLDLDTDAGNAVLTGHVDVKYQVSGIGLGLADTFNSGLHGMSAGLTNDITALSGGGSRSVVANWNVSRWEFVTSSVEFTNVPNTATAANAVIDTGDNNELKISTSSVAYKKDVRDLSIEESARFLSLRPIAFHSKFAKDGDGEFVGFLAEEVAVVDPRLVTNLNGKPNGVMYDRITVGLLGIVQQLQREIAEMKAKLS